MTELNVGLLTDNLLPPHANNDPNWHTGLSETVITLQGDNDVKVSCAEGDVVFKLLCPEIRSGRGRYVEQRTAIFEYLYQKAHSKDREQQEKYNKVLYYSPYLLTLSGKWKQALVPANTSWPGIDALVRLRLTDLFLDLIAPRNHVLTGWETTYILLSWQRYAFTAQVDSSLNRKDDYYRDLDLVIRQAAHQCLEIMIGPYAMRATYVFEQHRLPLDTSMNSLLWRDPVNCRHMWPWAYVTASDRTFTDQVMKTWYLPRYELRAGLALAAHDAMPAVNTVWQDAREFNPRGLLYGRLLGLSIAWLLPVMAALSIAIGLGTNIANWGKLGVGLGALHTLVLVIDIIWRGARALYAFAPRLTAGALVGLVVLAGLPDNAIAYFHNAFTPDNTYTSTLLIVFGLVSAFVYLYVKIDSAARDLKKRSILGRAMLLFLLGLSESALIATVASGLAHRFGFASAGTTPTLVLERLGLITNLNWSLHGDFIVMTTVLAFVTGVFLQILWADSPITDPL